MINILGKLRFVVLAACPLVLSMNNTTSAAEPTPAECAPVLYRAAGIMLLAQVTSAQRRDPSQLREGLRDVFQVKYRQIVFERMAVRDDKAGLDAAWKHPPSRDKAVEVGGNCISLYNSYRASGRIDVREEREAVNQANEWLRKETASLR